MSECFPKVFPVFWVEDEFWQCSHPKDNPLGFPFLSSSLNTSHRQTHKDFAWSHICALSPVHVSVCKHVHMCWPLCLRALLFRKALCVRIKISQVMYAVLLQFLMEVKPAVSSYPSSAVGRLWARQAAWNAEWQPYREVVWQPVISQKHLFSRICHISSLSPHFKMEKYFFFS